MPDGQKLYELRRERRIKQEDLASALGVTRQTVSKWENDAMPISEDKQREILQYFGVESLEVAVASSVKISFTANQKIVMAVIAVLFALACAATVVVGMLSIPDLHADETTVTNVYVDFGYFWLALGVAVILAGLEVFAVLAYRKENSKKHG